MPTGAVQDANPGTFLEGSQNERRSHAGVLDHAPGLAGLKPASSGLSSESRVQFPANAPASHESSQPTAWGGAPPPQLTVERPHWNVPRQPLAHRVLHDSSKPILYVERASVPYMY